MGSTEDAVFRIERSDGLQIRVGDAGILIGRHASCHLLLSDHRASRIHALIRPDDDGLKLFVTGANVVLVGRRPIKRWTELKAGDVLGFPGEQMTIHGPQEATPRAHWTIELSGGGLVRSPQASFSVGGGESDTLRVPGCPEQAVQFERAQGAMLATFRVPASIDGEAAPLQQMLSIHTDARIQVGAVQLKLFRELDVANAVTMAWIQEPPASEIGFRLLRSGAEIDLSYPDFSATVRLSELRARLLGLLIKPPAPRSCGDAVSGTELAQGLWPRRPEKDARDVEMLFQRLQKDLVSNGINPFRLVQRSARGMSLLLGPETRVVLR